MQRRSTGLKNSMGTLTVPNLFTIGNGSKGSDLTDRGDV